MESKLKHLSELEHVLKSLSIESSDVCVVGSAVLALHGLRSNNDIDIVVSKKVRNQVIKTSKAVNLSENIECVSQGWLTPLNDDEIVFNPDFHFVHNGIKFCKAEMVIERKKRSDKQKDKKDLELLNDKR
tara:strand:+ start:2979 stop:3368 length:390 start_codon:yes stop_codon:yes gene_type:complete